MKSILYDFFKVFSNSILILCLMMGSFLIIINVYHYNSINYPINKDLNESISYNEVQKKINSINEKVKNINNESIKNGFNNCLYSLNNGEFLKLNDKSSFKMKDVYDAAFDLKNNVSNMCLFTITYAIENSKIDSDKIINISNYVNNKKEYINTNNSFVINYMLGNSAYGYITDMTRNSVFNEDLEMLNLTIENYLLLTDTVDYLADWCLTNVGGVN